MIALDRAVDAVAFLATGRPPLMGLATGHRVRGSFFVVGAAWMGHARVVYGQKGGQAATKPLTGTSVRRKIVAGQSEAGSIPAAHHLFSFRVGRPGWKRHREPHCSTVSEGYEPTRWKAKAKPQFVPEMSTVFANGLGSLSRLLRQSVTTTREAK